MKLKMRNISNLDTFFKVINQCDGAVELSLPEGGSVNLKSKLSQYFSFQASDPVHGSGLLIHLSHNKPFTGQIGEQFFLLCEEGSLCHLAASPASPGEFPI